MGGGQASTRTVSERKRAVVARTVSFTGRGWERVRRCWRAAGWSSLLWVGAARVAVSLRLPVLLDGYALTTAGLLARELDPLVGEILIAGHRSAEPGHDLVLRELGLEPLLDLRLRLGEASGSGLALSLIEVAGAL